MSSFSSEFPGLPPREALEAAHVTQQELFVLETLVAGGEVNEKKWHAMVDQMFAEHGFQIILTFAARISTRMRNIQVGLTGHEGYEFPRKSFDHLIGRQDPQVRRDCWTVVDWVYKKRRNRDRAALQRLVDAGPASVYGLAETSLAVGMALADMDPQLESYHHLLQIESSGLAAHSLEQLAEHDKGPPPPPTAG